METAYDGIRGRVCRKTGIYDLLILMYDALLLIQAGENNTPKETILTYVWGFDSDAVENNVQKCALASCAKAQGNTAQSLSADTAAEGVGMPLKRR